MRVNENGQYVSDDGFWVWDGAAWIPADGSAAPASADAAANQTSETTQTTEAAAEAVAPAAETVHEPAANYEPEATQEYTAVDYASDTTAADSGSYAMPAYDSGADDSGSLHEQDHVVPHVDNQHPMSPDGRHWWDGEKWIDVSTDATTVHAASLAEEAPAESSWQPQVVAEPEPEPEVVAEPEPVAADPAPVQAERQLSPDGMWEWNGT